MNNSEVVKVGHAAHDLRELRVIEDLKSDLREETANELTNRGRFAFGLDLVYSMMFPFCIQSDAMWKY